MSKDISGLIRFGDLILRAELISSVSIFRDADKQVSIVEIKMQNRHEFTYEGEEAKSLAAYLHDLIPSAY